MEFGEMKRNTSNWSNYCMLPRRAGLSASAGLSCLPSGLSAYTTANADEKTPGGCSDLVRLVRLNLIRFLSINNTCPHITCGLLANELCIRRSRTVLRFYRVTLISVSVALDLTPQDHGYRVSVSRGMPVYSPAFPSFCWYLLTYPGGMDVGTNFSDFPETTG